MCMCSTHIHVPYTLYLVSPLAGDSFPLKVSEQSMFLAISRMLHKVTLTIEKWSTKHSKSVVHKHTHSLTHIRTESHTRTRICIHTDFLNIACTSVYH